MDPALQEFLFFEKHDKEVELIVKLADPQRIPPRVKVVCQFGDIAVCKVLVGEIPQIRADEAIISLKAPKQVSGEPTFGLEENEQNYPPIQTRVHNSETTGKNVAIGIIDWGFDFTHPNFRDPNTGKTRFKAIWDQTAPYHEPSAHKYGYGRVYYEEEINLALGTPAPFLALGYHPAQGSTDGGGAHGTHVADIAAGNGSVGEQGVAPQASLIAVHLSAGNVDGLSTLGDSARILTAIDFVGTIAEGMPLVINMSVGMHGGAHRGNSLVEQGMDNFLTEKPGRALVNSTGNYYHTRTHSMGRVEPGKISEITWEVNQFDTTSNELEIWYDPKDGFELTLCPPNLPNPSLMIPLGEHRDIILDSKLAGRAYHRKHEPNTGLNHINIFLYTEAPSGEWLIRLNGQHVLDGQYHAWIERDGNCPQCQSRFSETCADTNYSTGSICNGLYTIAVGAYDPRDENFKAAFFSSAGPTADGRKKPNLLAPGVGIQAARSSTSDQSFSSGLLTSKSGTSMAAPHVTGSIALLFDLHSERLLPIEETRTLLLSNLSPHLIKHPDYQYGNGNLDINRLLGLNEQKGPYMEHQPHHIAPLPSEASQGTTFQDVSENTDSIMNSNDSSQMPPQHYSSQTAHRDVRMVSNRNAQIRSNPNAGLRTLRRTFAQGILLEITQHHQNSSGNFVFGTEILPIGETRRPNSGWTSANNLQPNDATALNWPQLKANIALVAIREFNHWNTPGPSSERDTNMFTRQRDYWSQVGQNPSDAELGSATWQSQNAWSGVFISWVLRQAGAGDHFLYERAHSRYIVWARNNQHLQFNENPFWAYPINAPESAWPSPGDIICKNRGGQTLTLSTIASGHESHCDIVISVDRENREIITIGGNVDQRVAKRKIKLTTSGHIDNHAQWVIENATFDPTNSTGPQTDYFAIITVRLAPANIVNSSGNSQLQGRSAEEEVEADFETLELEESYAEFEKPYPDAEEDEVFSGPYDAYKFPFQKEEVTEMLEGELGDIEISTIEEHLGQHKHCEHCGEHFVAQVESLVEQNWWKILPINNPMAISESYMMLNYPTQFARNLFDHFAFVRTMPSGYNSYNHFELIAQPGKHINQALLPGDIILFRGAGEGAAFPAIVKKGVLRNSQQIPQITSNNRPLLPGLYAEIIIPGNMTNTQSIHDYRRIGDASGRLLRDTIVLRPKVNSVDEGMGHTHYENANLFEYYTDSNALFSAIANPQQAQSIVLNGQDIIPTEGRCINWRAVGANGDNLVFFHPNPKPHIRSQNVTRPLANITTIILHETAGWGENPPTNIAEKWVNGGVGAHFKICTDGTILQYYDVNRQLNHAGSNGYNGQSIGIEFTNLVWTRQRGPIVPGGQPFDKSPREVLDCWASQHYILPPIEQLEGLFRLLSVLNTQLSLDLTNPTKWRSYNYKGIMGDFKINRWDQSLIDAYRNTPGVYAHINISDPSDPTKRHSDGWFQNLYCFLRFCFSFTSIRAYNEAKNLTRQSARVRGGIVNLNPIAPTSSEPNVGVVPNIQTELLLQSIESFGPEAQFSNLVWTVTDSNALLRDPNNNFSPLPLSQAIAQWTDVRRTQVRRDRRGNEFWEVTDASLPSVVYGWSKKSNFTAYFKNQPRFRTIPTSPAVLLPTTQLTGYRLRATEIYNQVGNLINACSAYIGLDHRVPYAVMLKETNGRFMINNYPFIRFENHVFWNRWGRLSQANSALFDNHFTFCGHNVAGNTCSSCNAASPNISKCHKFRQNNTSPWQMLHPTGSSADQDLNLEALFAALRISNNDDAAYHSASYGSIQIMGFNHALIGYSDVGSLITNLQLPDGRYHVLALFDYLVNRRGSLTALMAVNPDWPAFGRLYNGRAGYGTELQDLLQHADSFPDTFVERTA